MTNKELKNNKKTAKPKKKDVGGRPTKYKKDFNKLAQIMGKAGLTDKEIADAFEVVESTIYEWKIRYPEFSESLKRGKNECDDRVEQTLYKRAIGYEEKDIKIFQFQGVVVEAPYIRKVDPSDTALIFWLKNRRPEKWREKKEIDLDLTDVQINLNIKGE